MFQLLPVWDANYIKNEQGLQNEDATTTISQRRHSPVPGVTCSNFVFLHLCVICVFQEKCQAAISKLQRPNAALISRWSSLRVDWDQNARNRLAVGLELRYPSLWIWNFMEFYGISWNITESYVYLCVSMSIYVYSLYLVSIFIQYTYRYIYIYIIHTYIHICMHTYIHT